MTPPSLRVQTVLYHNSSASLGRFLTAISTASALARREGIVGQAGLAIGDSSATPVLPQPETLDGWLLGAPFDTVSYTHYGANLGSAGGHNRLFEDLAEDLVLVCNPDTYASPRLVAELLGPLADPTVGVVEARQLPLEHPKGHDPATGDTSWASGSCFVARSEVIAATGGFDPDLFFLYCDDVDFSWRSRLAGWRVVHRPAARVFHDKRLTAEGLVDAGDAEIRYSAEASVLLAWRYSRPDIAERNLRGLEESPDERHRGVATVLRQRQRAMGLPEPLDPDGRVAQFVDGEYAVHRFSYAD
ncbi:MAG: glycosyltransferase family protein [Acidimicrobiales bacterium]